jgi:hypothetical protein
MTAKLHQHLRGAALPEQHGIGVVVGTGTKATECMLLHLDRPSLWWGEGRNGGRRRRREERRAEERGEEVRE